MMNFWNSKKTDMQKCWNAEIMKQWNDEMIKYWLEWTGIGGIWLEYAEIGLNRVEDAFIF